MGVSKKKGTPKSSMLIGFSIINHPFWGVFLLFSETSICRDDFMVAMNSGFLSSYQPWEFHIDDL